MNETGYQPIIAVTGATGFVGGTLARRLVAMGYRVRSMTRRPLTEAERESGIEWIEGALTDTDRFDALLKDARYCFHIAAMFRSEGTRSEFMQVNRDSTQALLAAGRRASNASSIVPRSACMAMSPRRRPTRIPRSIRATPIRKASFRPRICVGTK